MLKVGDRLHIYQIKDSINQDSSVLGDCQYLTNVIIRSRFNIDQVILIYNNCMIPDNVT